MSPPTPNCIFCEAREANSQLHPDVLKRLANILGTQVPDVFSRHKEIESKTEIEDRIGQQNLNETFSHVAVLFQSGAEFDRDEQLEQVAYIEDHLRRVMMEAFEQSVNEMIGELRDGKRSLERQYYRRAAPLIRMGRLQGHISPEQLQRRFDAILKQCLEARRAKVADGGWDEWKTASAELQNAAALTGELQRDIRAAVEAAHTSWRFALGVALAIILFVLSHVFF